MALSQDMIENVFGIDMGDQHGATNMEELLAKAEQEFRNRMEQESNESDHRQAKKRKNRKTEEAQIKQDQAVKEVS